MRSRFCLIILFLSLAALLGACATPYKYPQDPARATPALYHDYAVMDDGYRLPVRQWGNPETSVAIVLAVHGLNDYSRGFESTGSYLAQQQLTLLSYDQRGFGSTAGHGYWHGSQRMIDDSLIMLKLLQQKYPGKPLFLLGESMGGAIVLASLHQQHHEPGNTIAGAVLIAPAIWSRQWMPWYQRALLWLAAHTVPAKPLTGEGLDLKPSDNIEMLQAMGRDPLVIKATRVDVLYGVTNLMDLATKTSTDSKQPVLILYGKHDQIVPREPTCEWLYILPNENKAMREIIIYEHGYHMLNRDLQAQNVLDDITRWVKNTSNHTVGNDEYSLSSFHNEDKYNSVDEFCTGIVSSAP